MTNQTDNSPTARAQILGRLRERQPATAPLLPPPWRSRRAYDDLAAQFSAALTAAHGEVRRAAGLAGALAELSAIIAALGVRTAVANDEPPLAGLELAARWPDVSWRLAGRDGGQDGQAGWRAACAAADLGLTGADAALAETGSVVVSSGPGRSRWVPLLPPVHVALVPVDRLTTDLFTWVAGQPGGAAAARPALTTLISGPSKTGDIEQTMAIGVHGPKRFIAILY